MLKAAQEVVFPDDAGGPFVNFGTKSTIMSIENQTAPVLPGQRTNALIAYWNLRQLIGILGLSMPFVLPIGSGIFRGSWRIEPSISHYYYSIMHMLFMAILCMLGSFLITYRGTSRHARWEKIVSVSSGLFALGVAAFPTDFCGFEDAGHNQFISLVLRGGGAIVPKWMDVLHHVFAASLFTLFSVYCLVFFQDSDLYGTDDHEKKKRRNLIYTICGLLIIASMLAIVLAAWVFKSWQFEDYVYVFETTALVPFGFSWLLKGSVNWPHSRFGFLRKAIRPLR